jgi:hypothetical protein
MLVQWSSLNQNASGSFADQAAKHLPRCPLRC